MPRMLPAAKHRIIASDTPETLAKRKAVRVYVEAEKEELISEARQLMAPIIAQRKELTAITHDLRAERERQGLSLADVAARTGMDRASIHRLETSKSPNPTVSTLHRYAACLGVELHVSLVRS